MSNINAQCNPCRTCRYENDPQKLGHCYMFMKEPIKCGAFKPVNVGTIGHIDHGKTSLVAAMTHIISRDKPMKTILQIAEEEGFEILPTGNGGFIVEDTSAGDAIFRFAARIRANQREIDAKLCENIGLYDEDDPGKSCADEIRYSKD